MRYGTLFSLQSPPGSSVGHERLYEAAIEQIVDAERRGYEWVNLTEHHVAADGYLPATLTMLAAVAAVTSRIRLSTGMLLLAQHQPIRVAEEAAVVDNLSHGRLSLGVAIGYRELEFEALGVKMAARGKRFNESLEILRLAWAGEPFAFSGEVFEFPEVVVRPLPVQRPGIPLWLGGRSDMALRRAIRWRSPLFPGATDSIAMIEGLIEKYDGLRDEAGWGGPRQLVLPRLAVVAETTEEARRRALPAIEAMFNTYASWGSAGDFDEALSSWEALDEFALVGDEERVASQLGRYAELGVTDLMLQFAIPTLPIEAAAESQERFAAVAGL